MRDEQMLISNDVALVPLTVCSFASGLILPCLDLYGQRGYLSQRFLFTDPGHILLRKVDGSWIEYDKRVKLRQLQSFQHCKSNVVVGNMIP